ncbi:MAG TPA: NfeD family protein [Methylomirabilota bacterium]|nr:NfeD family protein [Methylomirabilota bacterium]
MRGFGRYLVWQAPSWVLVTLVAGWLVWGVGLPVWVGAGAIALFIVKDLLLFWPLRVVLKSPARVRPVDAEGRVVEALGPTGYVQVQGELWRARLEPDGRAEVGTRVRVRGISRLTLHVEPLAEDSPGTPPEP